MVEPVDVGGRLPGPVVVDADHDPGDEYGGERQPVSDLP